MAEGFLPDQSPSPPPSRIFPSHLAGLSFSHSHVAGLPCLRYFCQNVKRFTFNCGEVATFRQCLQKI